MDALVTGLSVGVSAVELAPVLSKFAIRLGNLGAKAISTTKANIYQFNKARLTRVHTLTKPICI